MNTECNACNKEHNLSFRETRHALMAIQAGDAQFMSARNGVLTMCISEAAAISMMQEHQGAA